MFCGRDLDMDSDAEQTSGDKKRFNLVKTAIVFGSVILFIVLLILFLQLYWAHRQDIYTPDSPKENLKDILENSVLSEEDYTTIFLQTGLGKSAVDYLLEQGSTGKNEIIDYQTAFFAKRKVHCFPFIGYFTCEDKSVDEDGNVIDGPAPVDLQDGDIILTLSTHSFGWRHGHAGLVVDTSGFGETLECAELGTVSSVSDASKWRQYSTYAIVRIKGITPETQKAVVDFSNAFLIGVPYHLSAGLVGKKAQDLSSESLGMQCSYLVWYAWNAMGYDLDSDGGKLVTTDDILNSKLVEVVQIYGIDPHEFLS
jgi:uncharacterized protein YycO